MPFVSASLDGVITLLIAETFVWVSLSTFVGFDAAALGVRDCGDITVCCGDAAGIWGWALATGD